MVQAVASGRRGVLPQFLSGLGSCPRQGNVVMRLEPQRRIFSPIISDGFLF
jgi:hypothetical protein